VKKCENDDYRTVIHRFVMIVLVRIKFERLIIILTKEQFYRCFDQKLKWYLLENGCQFLLVARSTTSDDKFWLFERTGEFEELLMSYKRNKYND